MIEICVTILLLRHATAQRSHSRASQLQGSGDASAVQLRGVGLIRLADLLKQAMHTKSLEQTSDLIGFFVRHPVAQVAVLESADHDSAGRYGFKKRHTPIPSKRLELGTAGREIFNQGLQFYLKV